MNTQLTEDKITEILENQFILTKLVPRETHAAAYRGLLDTNYVWYRTVLGLSENLTNSKKRANKNNWQCNLTLKYLAELWFEQRGRCALTGVLLDYETGDLSSKNPFRTSIDRIDNSRGYIKGNVRLVTHWANNAKSTWDDQIFAKFINAASDKIKENA